MPATGAAVELLLDAGWTDITADVYLRDRIRITRGRQDQGARVDPGACTLTLNNKGGRYSPRNPLSPLYGQIGRNTPIRVSAVGGDPWLGLPASGPARVRASTPDAAVLDITGDLDVRADLQPDDWSSTQEVEIAGKWGASGQHSWRFYMYSGFVFLGWTADGSTQITASAALGTAALTPRMCLRATLDVNNGSSGNTVTFYTAVSLAGPWTQLGSPVVTAGTTSIFNSTAPVEIGDLSSAAFGNASARLYGAQVRSGIGGTIVASPVFTAQAVGATSFTDTAPSPRTWTVTTGGITNRHTRFLGEISAWPARWDVSGGDVYVPVQAAGILRRLGQGALPLDSALRRSITDAAPLAYWPLEDGQAATQGASGLPGGSPLRGGAILPKFGTATPPPGSLPLPDFANGGALTAPVGDGSAASWTVEAVMQFPEVTDVFITPTPLLWRTAGAPIQWTMGGFTSDGSLFVQWNNTDTSASQFYSSGGGFFDGAWHHVRVTIAQSGTAITVKMWIDGVLDVDTSQAAFTLGPIIAMSVRGAAVWADAPPSVGHVAVWSPATAADTYPAVSGHDGETMGTRYERLSTEEGAPFTAPYGVVGTAALGPQLPAAFLDLLDEGADADVGILYEARDSIALAYRTRASLYDQAATLALDYETRGEVAPPLEPTEDDTATRNDITRSRPSGSSARVTLDEGALSTLAPPSGVGRYQDSQTVNVHSDGQLPDVAGWALHLGTWDEARYPAVTVNLAAGPWLAGAAMTVDLGDLITISNPPLWLPPDTISLMVQGYTETIGVYDWTLTYNCTPGGPWRVGVLDDAVLGRADTDGTVLAAGVSATATTLSLTVTAGPRWTTDAAQYPMDLRVGGEVVTATACSGTSNPQTMTVTRGVNGVTRAWDAGTDVRLAHPMILAL